MQLVGSYSYFSLCVRLSTPIAKKANVQRLEKCRCEQVEKVHRVMAGP